MLKKWKNLMNKLTIPAILVATIMVAGMFAFMPVEKASTVHTTVGQSGILLEERKTLPANGDDVTFTVACPANGGIITSVHADNTATPDVDDASFSFTGVTVGGVDFSAADGFDFGDINMGGGANEEEVRDLLRVIERNANFGVGQFTLICPPGDDVVFTFNDGGSLDAVILDLFVSIEGGQGGDLT